MSMQKLLQNGIHVHVSTTYLETESNPEQQQYFFAYRIRIENRASTPAQLISRYWIISNAHGVTEEVRGEGVVGQQPRIQPGQGFEYTSTCPLNTSTGSMAGKYFFIDSQGQDFEVEIPEFYLIAPMALH